MTATLEHATQLDDVISGETAALAGQEPASGKRPYWQDQPCPAWCLMGAPHQDDELPEDRYHMSAVHQVVLTLEKGNASYSANDGRLAFEPAFLMAMLQQHYRERDPQVILTVNSGEVDIPFTVTEADKLARMLAALTGEDSAHDEQCPSWCIDRKHADPFIEDRNHVGGYTMVALSPDEPHVWDPMGSGGAGDRPERVIELRKIGVRLWQGWREREARVDIVYRDEYTDLTLAEARKLSEALSSLVAGAAV